MKRAFLSCFLVALALMGLSCTPEATLQVSVTEIPDGVVVKNVCDVDRIVFVTSPEGKQQFELAVGENVTVRDISQPIEVSAVSL